MTDHPPASGRHAAAPDVPDVPHQPYLHRLELAVQAPAFVTATDDGDLGADAAAGLFVDDERVLDALDIRLSGAELVPVGVDPAAANRQVFTLIARGLGDPGPDPTVFVLRDRALHPDGLTETLTVRSRSREAVETELSVTIGTDFADIGEVKSGVGRAPAPAVGAVDSVSIRGDGVEVTVHAEPPPQRLDAGSARAVLRWQLSLPPRTDAPTRLRVEVRRPQASRTFVAPATRSVWPVLRVDSDRPELGRLLERSLADLGALLLADPESDGTADVFFAAGAPWYLTLFGRDSLWAARMALPLGTRVAGGTLRALARRQGRRHDTETAEEPGKILHEVRAADRAGPPDTDHVALLPPVYYGSVDATALWIGLLAESWRHGLPRDEVAALLPALRAALQWIRDDGLGDDGFVRYHDPTGRGLTNQGWKDSDDSVQFADGRLARGPIALCEAQAYAVEAARAGADLLDEFGEPGGDEWRTLADGLAARFRDRFWVGDVPAIAVDGTGQPVDSITSNIGHLLGTGLLAPDEERAVAGHLAGPDLDCGFGLRTLSSAAAGFNPLSYHAGSVWTHDTAIAIRGLASLRDPAADRAAVSLLDGLLRAADHFGYRLPELYGGTSRADGPPLPYPAACRPQAWSAASALVLLQVLLGLEVDVPGRRIRLAPLRPSPVGRLSVSGLAAGAGVLAVEIDADGEVRSVDAPAGFEVIVTDRPRVTDPADQERVGVDIRRQPALDHGDGRPTLTLFCGLPGAGKTTLARRLEAEGRGVRLATDAWQADLGITHSDVALHDRLQPLLYRHGLDLLRHGTDVVLEDGLWTAVERATKIADARAAGARVELHVFDVPFDVLWQRLQARNDGGDPTAYPMTEAELRWAWDLFEPPTAQELAAVDRVEHHH